MITEILEQFPDAILLFVGEGPIKQMLFNSAKQLGVLPKVLDKMKKDFNIEIECFASAINAESKIFC